MTAINKEIVRRWYAELNAGNRAVIDQLMTEDYVAHDPSLPPELCDGREAFKHAVAMSQAMMPGHQVTLHDLVAEGDRVSCRLTVAGRLAAYGDAPVSFTGLGMYRIADGRLAEGWFCFDETRLQRQIDAAKANELVLR